MEVTLKKASELSRAAIAAAKAVPIKRTVSISPYSTEETSDLLGRAVTTMEASVSRTAALLKAGYDLRGLVGQANARYGVDDLLTNVALIDETIKLTAVAPSEEYGAIDSSDFATVDHMVRTARTNIATPATDRYSLSSRGDAIVVNLMSDVLLAANAELIATLKRKRAGIKDSLTAINFSNRVTIPDEIVATLRSEKLID